MHRRLTLSPYIAGKRIWTVVAAHPLLLWFRENMYMRGRKPKVADAAVD